MNRTKEEEKTLKEVHDFRALCKEFPNVSFVVVDEIGELQPEYKGICNTSTFGDFEQVSIMIEEKVIENLDKDWDECICKYLCLENAKQINTAQSNLKRKSKSKLALKNRKILSLADAYLRENNISNQFEMLTYQKKISELEMVPMRWNGQRYPYKGIFGKSKYYLISYAFLVKRRNYLLSHCQNLIFIYFFHEYNGDHYRQKFCNYKTHPYKPGSAYIR